MSLRAVGAVVLILLSAGVGAPCAGAEEVIDVQTFASEADRQRYRALLDELRCPKCLNTNLSGSDSPIAADLRALVAERVRAGDDDDAIRTFLQARYGDFILYRPPLNARTALLWLAPVVLLAGGLLAVVIVAMRRRRAVVVALDPSERQALASLLERHAVAIDPRD